MASGGIAKPSSNAIRLCIRLGHPLTARVSEHGTLVQLPDHPCRPELSWVTRIAADDAVSPQVRQGFLLTSLFGLLGKYKRGHSVSRFTIRSIGDAVLTPVSNAI